MNNKEGLRYPSIDDLLDKIDSKYKLTYAAAKTAKLIEEKEIEVPNHKSFKTVGIALEEILNGQVIIDFNK